MSSSSKSSKNIPYSKVDVEPEVLASTEFLVKHTLSNIHYYSLPENINLPQSLLDFLYKLQAHTDSTNIKRISMQIEDLNSAFSEPFTQYGIDALGGAAIGGIGGSLLTGSVGGLLGGALIGGALGYANQKSKKSRRYHPRDNIYSQRYYGTWD